MMKLTSAAWRWLCAGTLAAALASAAAAATPPHNPHLSAPIYGVAHIDPSQSDAIPYAVPRAHYRVDLRRLEPIAGGPVNIMSYAATVPGFMWAVATDRVAYVDTRQGRWQSVAEIALPGIERRSPEQLRRMLQTRYTSIPQAETLLKQLLGPVPGGLMSAGIYSLVDADNQVWVNAGSWVNAFGLKDPANPQAGLVLLRRFDLATVFEPDQLGEHKFISVIGMNMSWDGHLAVSSTNALALLDRRLDRPPVVYRMPAGQFLTNSMAIDEGNGIYIATGSKRPRQPGLMMKLVWTGDRLSDAEADGAWRAEYDGGDWPPAIKVGTGSGATPTLMGFASDQDRLVLITDGSNRMKLLAFWRDEIPADAVTPAGASSRRVAAMLPISAGQGAEVAWVQSEQSVVVKGWGAFVVNNVAGKGHPDKIIDAFTLGPVNPPARGVERAEWDPASRRLRSVWTRADAVSVSMVPIVSSGSDTVFINGYRAADGWDVSGLDWQTGETVFRASFGPGNEGNGAYAILQFLPDGDLLFNAVAGPYRVPLSRAHPAVQRQRRP